MPREIDFASVDWRTALDAIGWRVYSAGPSEVRARPAHAPFDRVLLIADNGGEVNVLIERIEHVGSLPLNCGALTMASRVASTLADERIDWSCDLDR
jgi:hypothetical protein